MQKEGGKGDLLPLRIRRRGAQDIQVSSAPGVVWSRWQGPMRGARRWLPTCAGGCLWHRIHLLLPPAATAYRMEGRKRPGLSL